MSELLEFLTSQEAIVIYVVAGVACLLCLLFYFVEKNNVKLKQRHNTRELNKLVEQVREEANIEDEEVITEKPVLYAVEESTPVITDVQNVRDNIIVEPLSNSIDSSAELQYTSIEPDIETAQRELKKLTEELKKQEELVSSEIENHDLSNYEEEQEENAIISLEELVQKGKNMYAKNELTQYADEGNEPISLKELEEKSVLSTPSFQENFSITEVVPKEEILEESNNTPQTIKLDDFKTVKPDNEVIVNSKKFKSSPIISPIYGIEKNDIELENTANYEKLDAEIKRTNEFLMTLKDLQKKLD